MGGRLAGLFPKAASRWCFRRMQPEPMTLRATARPAVRRTGEEGVRWRESSRTRVTR